MSGSKTYTDDELLGALRAFHERTGRVPTALEWAWFGLRPSLGTIMARCGSWVQALQAAGLPVENRRGHPQRIEQTRKQAVALLRQVGEQHGGPLSMHEWNRLGLHPCANAVARTFGGSWLAAWEAAGFATSRRGRRATPDEAELETA